MLIVRSIPHANGQDMFDNMWPKYQINSSDSQQLSQEMKGKKSTLEIKFRVRFFPSYFFLLFFPFFSLSFLSLSRYHFDRHPRNDMILFPKLYARIKMDKKTDVLSRTKHLFSIFWWFFFPFASFSIVLYFGFLRYFSSCLTLHRMEMCEKIFAFSFVRHLLSLLTRIYMCCMQLLFDALTSKSWYRKPFARCASKIERRKWNWSEWTTESATRSNVKRRNERAREKKNKQEIAIQ